MGTHLNLLQRTSGAARSGQQARFERARADDPIMAPWSPTVRVRRVRSPSRSPLEQPALPAPVARRVRPLSGARYRQSSPSGGVSASAPSRYRRLSPASALVLSPSKRSTLSSFSSTSSSPSSSPASLPRALPGASPITRGKHLISPNMSSRVRWEPTFNPVTRAHEGAGSNPDGARKDERCLATGMGSRRMEVHKYVQRHADEDEAASTLSGW